MRSSCQWNELNGIRSIRAAISDIRYPLRVLLVGRQDAFPTDVFWPAVAAPAAIYARTALPIRVHLRSASPQGDRPCTL